MKRKLVNRLFTAFLSAVVVISDMTIPTFASSESSIVEEVDTVSEDAVSIIMSEDETLEDIEVIEEDIVSEESEDLSYKEESVSDDIITVEEVTDNAEDEEVIAEEVWDGVDYPTVPSDWGTCWIMFCANSSGVYNGVNNIFIGLYSTEAVTKTDAYPKYGHSYKLAIWGASGKSVDVDSTNWTAMNARSLTYDAKGWGNSGTKTKLDNDGTPHVEDYLPYVTEIQIDNLVGFSAASTVFPLATACTKIVFSTTSSIGSNTVAAFSGTPFKGMTKLQSIQLPASMSTLSSSYFEGCTALTSVTGASFTSIPSRCFYGCTSLTSVPSASSITSIGSNAFEKCTKLTSVPSSVQSIGSSAFYGCTAITSLSLPSVTSIGADAFRESGVASMSLKSGCSIGNNAFIKTKFTSVDVSNYTLGTTVFQNCSSLATLTCNTFDASQFSGCPLANITIKASGTLNTSLSGFSSYLTTVNAQNITSIGEGVFKNCYKLSNTTFGTLTSVGNSAFDGCQAITQNNVNIANLTSIGTDAFKGTNITKVVLNASLTSFPNAFSTCKLTSITMPGVTIIPSLTSFASYLTEVIANNATSISNGAFSNCKLLSTITIPKVVTVGESAFSNCTKVNHNNIDISQFTSIGLNAFMNTGITRITLNEKITEFPNAFSGCAVTTISMPGVESIGNGKLTGFKTTLTSVDGDKVTVLNESAFAGCTALKTVDFPMLKTIGNSVFTDCTSLTSAHHENVETIGNYAYNGCTNLAQITFEKARTIGVSAFEGCSKLTTLALSSVSTIEENAFKDCPIKALALDSILTIGKGAFSGCSELKSASIETATTVYREAFSGCEKLDALSLRDITLIEENAFYGMGNALTSKPVVAIPADKNVSIQKGAFVGNVGYVTYDATKDVWVEKVALGASQADVFGDAYILFNDGEKLYPTSSSDITTTPTESPREDGEDTDEDPTPVPSGAVTPTPSPTSSTEDITLTEDDIEDLIKKIVEILITGKPDANDSEAVQKWLESIKEIVDKYGFTDISALIESALENLDDSTELAKYIDQIIETLKGKIEDTINTLVDTAPSDTDSEEIIKWFFERVKKWAKDNGYIDLKNLANDGLDYIDDEIKRSEILSQIIEMLKEIQTSATPTPTPVSDTDLDPSAKYYDVIFYTYYDNAPHTYTEKVIEGGSVLNVPKAEMKGCEFIGWYDLTSLKNPKRWYLGTPVYKNLVLDAVFYDETTQKIKVVIPDVSFPLTGELDITNLPSPTVVTPGDGNSNNITSINFNILPSKGGLGDLSASGLDGFIDFGAITKNNTDIYMVKGQKVIDASVNIVSDNDKIVKVKLTKNGTQIQAKKEGVASLSVTNRLSGVTYKCRVYVVTPKMSTKSTTIKAGQNANVSIVCGSYTNKYPIYWFSSNVDVAYVEPSSIHGTAIIHGIGKGSTIITAYINGKAYKTKVKVQDTLKISSVAGVVSINPLETVDISKSGINGLDGFDAKNATWTYSVVGIVDINEKGVMTGKALGSTDVTGVDKYGTRKKFTVQVISIAPKTLHLNIGSSKNATIYKVPAKKAVWKSSNPEIATVNEKGKVSGHTAGVALITGSYMGFTYRYYVYVENPTIKATNFVGGSGKNYSLSLNRNSLTQLAFVYVDQPIMFISKNPEIAFVDENGLVRGRAAGTTTISTKVNKQAIKVKASVF